MSHAVSQITMMPSIELLLIAGRAVALVLGLLIFAWAFRHWRRAAMNDAQRVFEQLDLVRSELLIMKEVMHHAAHRSDSPVRSAVHDGRMHGASSHSGMTSGMTSGVTPGMASGLTSAMAPNMGSAVRGYEIAARMARNGADKDELMRSCGITSHEAELLIKLHGHRRDAQAQAAASLINRQPRMPESMAPGSIAREIAKEPVTSKTRSAEATRSAATAGRQATAAAETQRTAPRTPNLPPRSRLVAVG